VKIRTSYALIARHFKKIHARCTL